MVKKFCRSNGTACAAGLCLEHWCIVDKWEIQIQIKFVFGIRVTTGNSYSMLFVDLGLPGNGNLRRIR